MGLSVVMIGATGAVGGHVAKTLVQMPDVGRVTLLGRRPLDGISADKTVQTVIDVFDAASYEPILTGQDAAICTLGVGQPSKISKDEFVKIDKLAVLAFAESCKAAGVRQWRGNWNWKRWVLARMILPG